MSKHMHAGRRRPSGRLESPPPPAASERLLAAAEAIIAESGLSSLRTRALAARAELNMGMIRYCFGGVDELVTELLRLNVDRFVSVQSRLARDLPARPSIEAILHALLAPIQTPAAFTPGVRAAALMQEVFAHSSETVKGELANRMPLSFGPLLDRLVAACPHLSRDAVLWRFCCVCAGSLSLSPRAPAWQLFLTLAGHGPAIGEHELAELIATATGALKHPAAKPPRKK